MVILFVAHAAIATPLKPNPLAYYRGTMSVFDEILDELRSGDKYDTLLAEKASAELQALQKELTEYKQLYNDVARLLNSANFKLSEIGRIANVQRLTQREADLPVCSCSTKLTTTTLAIDPNCPTHGSASR